MQFSAIKVIAASSPTSHADFRHGFSQFKLNSLKKYDTAQIATVAYK
jgi:hypothetical protein